MARVNRPDPIWRPGDLDPLCRNHDGSTRMINRAAASVAVGRKVNHCAAYMPRIAACMAYPFDSRPTPSGDADPLYQWKSNDYVHNGTDRVFTVLHVPRESDPSPTSDAYFERLDSSLADDTATQSTKHQSIAPASPALEHVAGPDTATYDRGASADAYELEGIATHNAYSVLDFVVQDQWHRELNDAEHEFVELSPRKDHLVLDDVGEQIRARLHDLRRYNLPVVGCWLAYADGDPATYATTAITAGTGGPTGVRVQSGTQVNIFRQATTTWAAAGPGFHVHAYRRGIGDETQAATRKLRIRCDALVATDGNGGNVIFEGPTAIASNTVTMTATSSTPSWLGTSADPIYLDTNVDRDDASTSAPMITVSAWVSGTSSNVYIYGALCWIEYGI